ncbi:type II toxin-antitoxin system RelE/ParE family toxin [Micromonospora sp. NPDC049359]|uniref:type II toxin-antitoxin system RelE/ParE family toxin n=1 Tax=Micromonospora sp. NPDC049359 TaxID=3364270 RepID=UPI0037A089C6
MPQDEWEVFVVDEVRAWIDSLDLKELRPGTVRILFVFDPWRASILLVAGDKAGQWQSWYQQAIPLAEQRYEIYLKERAQQEGGQR